MSKQSVRMLCTAWVAVLLLSGFHMAMAQEVTIKIGHIASTEDEDHKGALVFKDFVEAQTNGRVKVEVYPGGQLCGNFRQCLEAVQLGAVEITGTTVGGAANIFPEIQVTDIPYMFPNDRVAEKVMKSEFMNELRAAVLKKTGTLRLMGLNNTGGWRDFFTTTKPIKTPADLKGVKIRTIESELQVEMVKLLGGSPTPIPWQELYTSLATGVVVGTKNGITDITNMKFHEFLRYVTLDHHAYMFLFWWMNDSFLKNLPADLKQVVLDGFHHMTTVANNDPKYTQLAAYEDFKKKGGKVYVPSAEEKAQFVEKVKPLKQWFVDKYGDHWLNLLEGSIEKAKAEIAAEDAAVLQ
ncbi:MAG: C4-dicarboxylate ABC transporter substrate-binding protein [Candidatus Entotheonella gemina]|uniref:C4-dicarboxylate ABC transporter substrate-binding protein n=1 Tax=Candidatus Entotheonella gemina TaxID=1429439 RepID=W4M6V1_9BACT|nr:MAG: C4-dicarboxylate ABC transporter substrate-binding protein [Candidatus Entotheonella gemina]